MADEREYMYFYLIGRNDDELASEVDLTVMAERVMAGQSLREVTYKVATDAARAAEHGGHRRDWLLSNKDEVAEAGGNESKAYDLYLQGQIDELAHSLEAEVMGEINELLDDIDLAQSTSDDDGDGEDDEPETIV